MVFRVKLLVLTMTGILLMGIIPLAVTGLRRGQLRDEMMGELNTLGRSECAKVAKDVGGPEYAVAGLHIFTFNQVAETEAWRQSLLAQQR